MKDIGILMGCARFFETKVNISGSITPEKSSKPVPSSKPAVVAKGVNKGLVRLRLASQQDETEADDGNAADGASPRIREMTETNDSYAYDYKGMSCGVSL